MPSATDVTKSNKQGAVGPLTTFATTMKQVCISHFARDSTVVAHHKLNADSQLIHAGDVSIVLRKQSTFLLREIRKKWAAETNSLNKHGFICTIHWSPAAIPTVNCFQKIFHYQEICGSVIGAVSSKIYHSSICNTRAKYLRYNFKW